MVVVILWCWFGLPVIAEREGGQVGRGAGDCGRFAEPEYGDSCYTFNLEDFVATRGYHVASNFDNCYSFLFFLYEYLSREANYSAAACIDRVKMSSI